jgi:exonuclease SbcD
MKEALKILLLADTHLGYDEPLRPRVQRRRRGEDFFSNYRRALDAAREEGADLVVHGGDLFFRGDPPPAVVERAYGPLLGLANAGIPVLIVPGNHERSRLPDHLWLSHKDIHIFDRPRTFTLQVGGLNVALSGFPFAREARERFHSRLEETGYREAQADLHFLCAHQTFEGAQVGPVDYTFRSGPESIPGEWVPDQFCALLCGHIHRGQQLTRSLDGRRLAAPILYPGSIERASFAERFEEKYYLVITAYPSRDRTRLNVERRLLPARPMVKLEIAVGDRDLEGVKLLIRDRLALLKPDAVVRVDLTGKERERCLAGLSAPILRALAPESMNISLGRDWAFQYQGPPGRG